MNENHKAILEVALSKALVFVRNKNRNGANELGLEYLLEDALVSINPQSLLTIGIKGSTL